MILIGHKSILRTSLLSTLVFALKKIKVIAGNSSARNWRSSTIIISLIGDNGGTEIAGLEAIKWNQGDTKMNATAPSAAHVLRWIIKNVYQNCKWNPGLKWTCSNIIMKVC